MPLSSQSARIGIARGGASRRRRRLGKLPLILLGVALIAGLAFFFWPGGNPADVAGRPGLAPPSSDPPTSDRDANATPPAGDSAAAPGKRPAAAPDDARVPVNLDLGGTSSPSGSDEPGGASLQLADPLPGPTHDHITPDAPRPDTPDAPPAVNDSPNPQPPTPNTQHPPITEAMQRTREAVPPPTEVRSSADAMSLYNQADQRLADGDPVGGRALLSRLLFSPDLKLSASDATVIRNRLTEVNQKLVFSPEIFANDPLAERHVVQSGELLASIGVKYKVPYQLLEIVNNTKARSLQADRPIKVIRGPIHARVLKHQFLMDLYAYGNDGLPVYLNSFRVGLGQDDKTPVGQWALTKGEKVVNPDWRDDLTNEYYPSNDPKNPIGEFWMAIHGTDDNTKSKTGFGIHGTIEPDSIGTQASRGCIRLADDDIELLFYMLTELGSTVEVLP